MSGAGSSHEDSTLDVPKFLPRYTCVLGEVGIDNDNLDQSLKLTEAMFMSMLSCDLIQTKNLAGERGGLAKRIGIALENDNVMVEK